MTTSFWSFFLCYAAWNYRYDIPAANNSNPSLSALLNAPARINQTHLHPDKRNGALLFKVDKSVLKYVRTIWQNNFMGLWWNWSMVPKEKKDAWWADFVQNYYWEPRYHSLVKAKWKLGCMDSRSGLISTKKRIFLKKKNLDIEPHYISADQWKAMHVEWAKEENVNKSKDAADSRTTDLGDGMHKHCAGPKAFAALEYEMMMEVGEGLVPYTALLKKAHTRKDGTYVDKRVEAIVSKVELRATQMATSDESPDDFYAVPSSLILNKAFLEWSYVLHKCHCL